jgi:hypothetical protein
MNQGKVKVIPYNPLDGHTQRQITMGTQIVQSQKDPR